MCEELEEENDINIEEGRLMNNTFERRHVLVYPSCSLIIFNFPSVLHI